MPLPPMHRLRVLIVAATLTASATPLLPASAASVSPISCPKKSRIEGDWQALTAPVFAPAAGIEQVTAGVTAYAVDPTDPRRVAVTNGNSIYVSGNGGCSWDFALGLAAVPNVQTDPPLSGSTTKITKLAMSAATKRIWAIAEEGTGDGSRPHVIFSDSGLAGSWRLGDVGLPPVGKPGAFVPAPRDPRTVYFAISGAESGSDSPLPGVPVTPEPVGVLWVTTDGGTNWSLRSDVADFGRGAATIRDLAVSHDDPDVLYAIVAGALYESTDAGRSFARPDGTEDGNHQLTVVETMPGATGREVVALGNGRTVLTTSRGEGWLDLTVPFGSAASVAATASEIAVVTNDGSSAQLFKSNIARLSWRDVSPKTTLNATADVQKSGSAGQTFYVKSSQLILRYLGEQPKGGPRIDPPDFEEVGELPPVDGRLTPGAFVLPIPPGQERTIRYRLDLPASPTPLELYLLIDGSGSMRDVINNLKANLNEVVRQLTERKIPVRVGVGIVRVFPDGAAGLITQPKPVYERLREIGPPGPEFAAAMNEIQPDPNLKGKEAQLEALYQAATGVGVRPVPLIPAYSVAPGQHAGFSNIHALRVIVHATDEGFVDKPAKGEPEPEEREGRSFGEAITALKNAGVIQIGLSRTPSRPSRPHLERIARATGALAPRGGIDCDGDGRIDSRVVGGADLLAGEPLVCGGNAENGFAKVFFDMLNGLVDRQPVQVITSKSPVVAKVTPARFVADVKKPSAHLFDVTFSCKGRRPGSYSVNVGAVLRSRTTARAAATIICGNSPLSQAAPPIVPIAPAQQSNIQPGPPVPVPPQPVAQTQAQVQSQTQVQAQAGAASQEQEEYQVAGATNDITEEKRGEAGQQAMVAVDPASAAATDPAYVLLAGMTFAACAGAVAYGRQRRTATAPARAWIRRSR